MLSQMILRLRLREPSLKEALVFARLSVSRQITSMLVLRCNTLSMFSNTRPFVMSTWVQQRVGSQGFRLKVSVKIRLVRVRVGLGFKLVLGLRLGSS